LKKIKGMQKTTKLTIKVANIVFMVGIFYFTMLAMFTMYKIINGRYLTSGGPELTSQVLFYYLSFFITSLFVALLVVGLRKLQEEIKVNLSVMMITICIIVFTFEVYLEFHDNINKIRASRAKKMGISFDSRSRLEVFEDLMNSGINVYPNIHARELTTNKGLLYTLGTISNATTILGKNEAGYYPIIETDEYGFNNQKGLYEKNKVNIMLIGDSFAEGCYVQSNETIGAVLCESGYNALSVGMAGNGPFAELASVKEYAEPLKSRIVLWLYNEADLFDLNKELKSPLLSRYLNEDNFSQNLISRQEEIDSTLINYSSRMKLKLELIIDNTIIKIIKLTNLRNLLIHTTTDKYKINIENISIFKNIIQKSKKIVKGWGGKMYFVYLPNHQYKNKDDKFRKHVLRTITELEVPIIDIQKKVFDRHPEPLSLFPFSVSGHYNADGYRLVAEAIHKRIEADGIFPVK